MINHKLIPKLIHIHLQKNIYTTVGAFQLMIDKEIQSEIKIDFGFLVV